MYSYENKHKNNVFKSLLLVLGTVLITIGVIKFTPFFYQVTANSPDENSVERLNYSYSQTYDYPNTILSFPEIINNSMKSIVGISVLEPDGDSIFDPNVTQKWGIGTGIIVSENGYILTNQHLASRINSLVSVTLDNGKTVQGRVIWNEKNIDLAIVKINEDNLTPLPLGNSNQVTVGEEVVAIGNPLGFEFHRSATKGIVSGINRTLKVEDDISSVIMEDLIQTDASINTGNSGGPLINSSGEVIGINTVKISSAEGIGFAVPVNVVKPIIEKLVTNNTFSEAYLGLYAFDKEILPYVDSNLNNIKGIYVANVLENGPSYNAGVKVGDVITKVDDLEIDKMIKLREYLYSKEPGDTLNVEILRNNEIINLAVKLSNKNL